MQILVVSLLVTDGTDYENSEINPHAHTRVD